MMNNYYPIMSFPYPGQFAFSQPAPEELLARPVEVKKNEAKQAVVHVPNTVPEAKLTTDIHKRRIIGLLSYEERQKKINKYRAKRSTRVWIKKISYSCRKRVADQRPRVKGRFVSKNERAQANSVLCANKGSAEAGCSVVECQQVNSQSECQEKIPSQKNVGKDESGKKMTKDVFYVLRNDNKDAQSATSN